MSNQSEAQRIGICLNDYEMFWWNADDNEPCPVCSGDEIDYKAKHRFYVAEALAGDAE